MINSIKVGVKSKVLNSSLEHQIGVESLVSSHGRISGLELGLNLELLVKVEFGSDLCTRSIGSGNSNQGHVRFGVKGASRVLDQISISVSNLKLQSGLG